jgi:hypothetical protein
VLLSNFKPGTAISFGGLVNIADNGDVVRRYADLRLPSSKTLRLLKYFWDQEFDGKANLIYGMYERAGLLEAGVRDDYAGVPFVDMHFVFSQLERGTIVTDPSVCLYKRMSRTAPARDALWNRVVTGLGTDRDTLRSMMAFPRLLHDPMAKGAVYALLPARLAKRVATGATRGAWAFWKRARGSLGAGER